MANRIDPQRAWAAYQPSDKNPWNLQKVGHLYRRAAFGATWSQLQSGLERGPEKTIDLLLKGDVGLAEFEASMNKLVPGVQRLFDITQSSAWWLARMMQSPHPLREKLTLFWHNHFATSFAKVQNIGYMIGQYQTMYQHALGNFGEMLHAISKDPAMMIWLDTIDSKKGKPNENYARELMELFSLGIGNYTEKDIREAAKALTGWEIQDGKWHFNSKQHDESTKTVLGQAGNWRGEDIVKICLDQKACPKFIVGKLYRYLISETEAPNEDLLKPLTEKFGKNYDLLALVGTMLRSNLFFSETAYRQRIKSPVDFILSIVKGLEGKIGTANLARNLESLGQNLFQPPSVKGWDGGPTWLNGQTVLFRNNLALTLSQTRHREVGSSNSIPLSVSVCEKNKKTDLNDRIDFLLQLFLQGDVAEESTNRLKQYAQQARSQTYPAHWSQSRRSEHATISLCHLVLTLPEYQLD